MQDDKLVFSLDGVEVSPTDRIQQVNVAGMSIHLITEYSDITALNYGVADKISQQPMSSNTIFQAGGLTNTVTNVAAMIAVQEGKINLTANVNDYLTTWKLPENSFQRKNPVTLEDLLLKRRGFKQQSKPNGYIKGDVIPSLLDVMNGSGEVNTKAIQLRSATTTRDNYSFETEMVVQVLLQDLYGQSFNDIIQEKIFHPLEMNDSFFATEVPHNLTIQMAHGYLQDGSAIPGIYKRYPETASSGLWTSSKDYGKLVLNLMLSAAGKENGLLSIETAKTCFLPQNKSKALIGNSFGSDSTVLYGGAAYGYRTQFEFFPDKGWGIVVFMNSNQNWQFMNETMRAIKKSYGI